jgi:hypothetical protein
MKKLAKVSLLVIAVSLLGASIVWAQTGPLSQPVPDPRDPSTMWGLLAGGLAAGTMLVKQLWNDRQN